MNDNSELTPPLTPEGGWLGAVPLELHGHRKKLDFFRDSLEAYGGQNNVSRGDISVVEVGCSNGRNISLPLAEAGYNVTGVDIHAPSIEWAEAHNSFSNARFVCRDFAEFSETEFFDVVVLSDILEHVHEPLHIIRLALDHLKPDGMVLVCIPNGYGPYENEQRFLKFTRLDRLVALSKRGIKRLMGRKPEKQNAYNYDSGHVQFFRTADFEQLAADAGLEIEKRANGALFGGGITYALGVFMPFIVKPSLWLADRLPAAWVTTWYFKLNRLPISNKFGIGE